MKTLVNFRNLGGHKTMEGAVLKPFRILRSGEPVGLAEEDINVLLNQYKLKNIVDFRGQGETYKRPVDKILGTNYYNFDILKSTPGNTTSFEDLLKEDQEDDVDTNMIEIYHNMMLDPTAQSGYRKFLDVLLRQKEGSTLFH